MDTPISGRRTRGETQAGTSVETAIVIVVPESEPVIGRWVREHTTAGAQGMPPHVTLLYPFMDTSEYTARVEGRVGDVLRGAGVMPIPFSLSHAAYFRGDPNTLYLAPEPAAPFQAVTNELAREFPAYPPYRGVHAEVIPHLAVAQSNDAGSLTRIEEEVSVKLPIEAVAGEVQLMEHAPDGWRVRRTFVLG
jgi:2'-5' RNA ligase